MCGIIGAHGSTFSAAEVKAGLKQIHHRGPDESFLGAEGHFSWGMARLSIRDLQPNLYPFSFGRYKLIFNGELYNLTQLRRLAARLGFHARTNCDAEVILPLYHHFGDQCLALLRGMFAVAIYDLEQETITLARDRFGEKPLYYYHQADQFFFSSEVSAFPNRLKQLSLDSVSRFANLGFNPGAHTMYRSIHKVAAGQLVRFSRNKQAVSVARYASLVAEAEAVSNVADQDVSPVALDTVLHRVVAEKMASDVPVGLFLSGGLDSSLLAALAQRYHSQPLNSFSVGFAHDQLDESAFSGQVARHLGTKHHHQTVSSAAAKEVWDTYLTKMDEPICDPACLPTYLLAKQARQHVTVVLTGEGADEFFAGYPRYQKEQLAGQAAAASMGLLEQLSLVVGSRRLWRVTAPLTHHYHSVTYMSSWYGGLANRQKVADQVGELWTALLDQQAAKGSSSLTQTALMQLYDLEYYVADQLCMKNDKTIMQHSVESRAPYLDTRLLPWLVASAQASELGCQPKMFLRQVAEKYLPHSIVSRPKHGFSLPLVEWLASDFRDDFELLATPHELLIEAVGSSAINRLLTKYKKGKTELALSVWNIMTINSWLRKNGA